MRALQSGTHLAGQRHALFAESANLRLCEAFQKFLNFFAEPILFRRVS
ncbi:hypothetical protein Q644_00850 [Brucella intermedia 229E]|uniref:Uncharacterized protein n=1 Tax=Brucella intermedia 229E TaxID=1337887 RepID=U4VL98_9HYPH|nr:hypothetical protein Q644_00850 [Brucella intermedia 229E]